MKYDLEARTVGVSSVYPAAVCVCVCVGVGVHVCRCRCTCVCHDVFACFHNFFLYLRILRANLTQSGASLGLSYESLV